MKLNSSGSSLGCDWGEGESKMKEREKSSLMPMFHVEHSICTEFRADFFPEVFEFLTSVSKC